MKFPKKIIINLGLARCGTTATSKLFSEDLPGFATPRGVKELKYFLNNDDVEGYLSKFDYSENDILFESSPPYMHSGLETFRLVIDRITKLRAAGIDVHLLFHLRNLSKRAFSHYWHDINGQYAIFGRLWSVRKLDDERRYRALYARSFPEELSQEKNDKFCPELGEMLQYALSEFGPDHVHIAHLPSIDACLTDLVLRVEADGSADRVSLPRTPGVAAPEFVSGGRHGEVRTFGTAPDAQDIEIPGNCCVLLARRHAEILDGQTFNIPGIVAAAQAWSYSVEEKEIADLMRSYVARQVDALRTVPETSFLNGAKNDVLSEIAESPGRMAVKRREISANEILSLVWDHQAINAEKDGKVTIGRGDRLFLHYDMNEVLPQHLGRSPLTQDQIDAWTRLLSARVSYCEQCGIDYGMIFAPDTHAIYREDLPALDGVQAKRPMLQLLEAYEGSSVYYPCGDLRGARGKGEVCDVTDSHWSPFGAYVAYKKILPKVAPNVPVIPDSQIRLSDQIVVGDLGAKFTPPRKGRTTQVVLKTPKAVKVWNNGVSNRGHMSYWKNSDQSLARAILLTDSYGWRFQRFLAESFRSLFIIHSPLLETDLIDAFRPDVVISLMAERFVPKVPDDVAGQGALDMARQKQPGFVLPEFDVLEAMEI